VFASLRRHRNFRLYFSGQIVSLSGTWMADTALPWLALELSGSPFAVGVVAFCRFAPFTVFGLFSGALIERLDTRRTLIGAQVASMPVATTIAVLTLTGSVELWHVYLLAAAGGFLVLVELPSRQVFTFELVGRDLLPNAVALNTSLHNAARIVGPALGGLVIAAAGVGWCFALNAASFAAALGALVAIRPGELVRAARPGPPLGALRGLRDAARFAWSSPRIRVVLLLLAVLSLVGVNFRVLLPVLAESTLDAGAGVFGLLFAAFGAGALAGSLLSATVGWASSRTFLAAFGAYSAALLVLAPLREPAAAAVLLFVIGACFSVWATSGQSIVLLDASDELRGRLTSILLFAFLGVQPVGSLLAGWLADAGGTRLAFAVAGCVGALATVAAVAVLARAGALGRAPLPAAGAAEQPPAA
jgi:MFS family permease